MRCVDGHAPTADASACTHSWDGRVLPRFHADMRRYGCDPVHGAGHHNRGGSSAQSESATSHGSATSAPLSEISEWGDAQDESDSETDDEGGNGGAGAGRRKGWNKVLPQAREIETLEKMLMRVQEMRRHHYR